MLINEINDKCAELPKAIKLMGKYGREMAQAEADYYKAKAEATFQLQAEGIPATTISNVIKGRVSDYLYKMELSKTMYETSKEYINTLKTQIRVLEQQISIEWSDAKNG